MSAFTEKELRNLSDFVVRYNIGRHVAWAECMQRDNWSLYADDLIGVPEVDPFADPWEPAQ